MGIVIFVAYSRNVLACSQISSLVCIVNDIRMRHLLERDVLMVIER